MHKNCDTVYRGKKRNWNLKIENIPKPFKMLRQVNCFMVHLKAAEFLLFFTYRRVLNQQKIMQCETDLLILKRYLQKILRLLSTAFP